MRLVLIVVVLLAHHAVAHAKCKRGGKVIYKEVQTQLNEEKAEPAAIFTITSTGAWKQDSTESGCLTKAHLKELLRAIARAKFVAGNPEMCDAVTEYEVVISAPKRKKHVRISAPCGVPADPATEALRQCAHATSDIRAICRGQP